MEKLDGAWILITVSDDGKARMKACNLTPGMRSQTLINALVASAIDIGIGCDELIDAASAAIEEKYEKYEEGSKA